MFEVYGKEDCIFCEKTKKLLEKNDIEYVYFQLGVDFTREELLEKFPLAKTYPQIVKRVDSQIYYIGGYDNLETMFG